jgi:hypothetical protein
MSKVMELAKLPPKESALTVFSAEQGLDPYLAKIRAEIDDFEPEVGTKKGRDAIASIAFKVAKVKVALDDMGKEVNANLKEIPKKVDAERKRMRDLLDAWKDEVRQPLTDWENAETQRVQQHEQAIAMIAAFAVDLDGMAAADLRQCLTDADAILIGAQWEEFEVEALRTKEATVSKLRAAIMARERYESEQAELERLRAEAAHRAELDREALIAQQAADLAREQAQEAAKVERDAAARREREAAEAAEKRELELKLQTERAERDRIEANSRAEQAIRDSARRAEEAAGAERARQAAELAQAAADTKAREADKAHKTTINRAALAAFVTGGMTEECAKLAVTLIAKKAIPAIRISY